MNIEYYLKRDYITNVISQGKRIDGRAFDEMRQLTITKGYAADKACGSAYVKLGDTEVIAGISMDVGEPYPDQPTSGIMSTSTEFRPIASPQFESGPPREDAIEVARVVDRGIRESKMMDMEKLAIDAEKVWAVFIDIHILNHDGNLIDASGIASTAAILDCRMPKLENGKVIRGEWAGKLPLTCTPIPITFHKIGHSIIVDPTIEEEYAMDARLTVTTTDTLNAMQKGGLGSFTMDEVKDCVDKAFKTAPKIRSIVEG
ncbi:MAG: exosome complex protein Rrp42 [Candidatus Altiarchaeota archaeon]